MTGTAEVSLSAAAHRLGVSWAQAWRLVLRRELEGRKSGSRWVVSVESLERLAQVSRSTGPGSPAREG